MLEMKNDVLCRKRTRSEDSDSSVLQKKKYLNERLMNCNNNMKLMEVYSKTMNTLFKAARTTQCELKKGHAGTPVPLSKQLILMANGEIHLRDFTTEGDVMLKRSKADCCRRETLIQGKCGNCSLPLCEYCGYTCVGEECDEFLCGACVNVFQCGTSDAPLCEKCNLYR